MSAATSALTLRDAKCCTLLYIEDDGPTAEIFRSFLMEDRYRYIRFVLVADVTAAMAAVERSGIYAEMAKPDLIVLDLNLPCVNGFAVLEEIRATRDLKETPVVFSSSLSDCDHRQAEVLGATEFIVKPMDLDEFGKAVEHICSLIAA